MGASVEFTAEAVQMSLTSCSFKFGNSFKLTLEARPRALQMKCLRRICRALAKEGRFLKCRNMCSLTWACLCSTSSL